jgi:hypothetical protein
MQNSCLREKMKKFRLRICCFLCLWAIFILLQLPCSAANVENKSEASKDEKLSITEKKWGIRPLSIQLTATGNLLDYRFRVIYPDKALALMKRGDNIYLIDQASGIRLTVPRTKVGPLRQTGSKPRAGKVYPVLFTNTGMVIKPGSKVTLVVGDFRMENIVVGAPIPYLEELPQAKQSKWKGVQKMLGDERGACMEDCGQDQSCFDKCEKAFRGRLDKEYQSLLYQK